VKTCAPGDVAAGEPDPDGLRAGGADEDAAFECDPPPPHELSASAAINHANFFMHNLHSENFLARQRCKIFRSREKPSTVEISDGDAMISGGAGPSPCPDRAWRGGPEAAAVSPAPMAWSC
jgi:hypothetical protein